jgi:uncharacterized protein DUF3168
MTLELWPDAVRDTSPLELIETDAIGQLRADPRLAAIVAGRIYTSIPPGTPFPLVWLGGATAEPWQRQRHAGINATLLCRASSQTYGPYEVHRIADLIRAILEARSTPAPPFRRLAWTYDSSAAVYTDNLAGILTYHRPVVMRARLTIA